eukprot:1885023-Amphidinium_carterae.1
MAIPTISMRKIQKNTNDVLCESQREKGPPPGLRAGGGAHKNKKKNEDPLGSWRTCRPQGATPRSMNMKRTSL